MEGWREKEEERKEKNSFFFVIILINIRPLSVLHGIKTPTEATTFKDKISYLQ
jgi:hypothetical protein